MRALTLVLALLVPGVAGAVECRDATFDGASFTVCEVAAGEDLRLFLNDAAGAPYGAFSAIETDLAAQGQHLGFAMNAGMYQPDLSPVGLFVENGVERAAIVTSDGPGNFGLLPNGVFCILPGGAGFAVVESRRFADSGPACQYASQSGPMLVLGGELHPRFIAASPSTHRRNGVGVTADGQRAVFAISNEQVNFHLFARFFRDALELPDALYFDGSISRLYAPDLGRRDAGFAMGPMVGVVVPD
jgi:uncharacterized protein YigE (DUF2233 family)